MQDKHTPGPWLVNTAGHGHNDAIVIDQIYVYAPGPSDDVSIAADIVNPKTGEPSIANARLVATAPDLLDALLEYDHAFHNLNLECKESRVRMLSAVDKARAAIAKATGA